VIVQTPLLAAWTVGKTWAPAHGLDIERGAERAQSSAGAEYEHFPQQARMLVGHADMEVVVAAAWDQAIGLVPVGVGWCGVGIAVAQRAVIHEPAEVGV